MIMQEESHYNISDSRSSIQEIDKCNIESSQSLSNLPSVSQSISTSWEGDKDNDNALKGSVGGILRKISLKRKASITKQRRKQEKRLSAVIGCYLTPSILGWRDEGDCQVDSSSWEFLDQNEEPRVEYFKEIENQVELNSRSVEILIPENK